jgi:hypothetical protein
MGGDDDNYAFDEELHGDLGFDIDDPGKDETEAILPDQGDDIEDD